MKRRVLITIFATSIAGMAVVSCGRAAESGQSNASRRSDNDVAVVDEDMTGLDGSLNMEEGTAKSTTEELPGNKLGQSVIQEVANAPVADDVQTVRKLILPEAVVMDPGDVVAFYNNEDFKDVVPVDAGSFDRAQLPSSYDSREVEGKRYVTEVEDQGYSYLCWTYACMGAIESDLLRHHGELSYKDIDLSEKHLAYYNMHKAEGSVGGYIDNDYRELVNAEDKPGAWIFDYDTGYVAVGGVTDCCISLLAAWKGPVAEEGDNAFKSLYGSNYLFTDNSKETSDPYESLYHVQGVYEVKADIEHNLMVKQMIMEHGAATVGVNADGIYWKDHNSKLYSSFGGQKAPTANHEVLIVGWDDDYSATNFRQSPEGDGAWICKNSWGANSGDGGFFYLSYYDETVAISNAAAYDVAMDGDDDWYDHNYQVAGFMNNIASTLEDSENMVTAYSYAANPYGVMYEASGSESLKAVGLMALDMYQQYEIEAYVNPDYEDGKVTFTSQDEPVIRQKVSAVSGGYHTFALDRTVDLDKGDTFFILVKPETEGRLVFEPAEDSVSTANYDEWQNLTGNVHNNYSASKRSFYISDDGLSMERQDDKDFFVKAYTCDR